MKFKNLTLLICLFSIQVYGQYQIPVGVFGNGGEELSGPSFQMYSTVGEAATGAVRSDNFAVQVGAGFISPCKQLTGGCIAVPVEQPEETVPSDFQIHQNYPNPFNPGTTIRYDLPEAGNVNISVFDLTGRLVRTLQDGRKAAGSHTVNFNALGLASGVYFYQIRAGHFIQTKRMLLIK